MDYDINWSDFDQSTDLEYSASWSLVGVDSGGTTTLYTGPILVSGVSSNGATSTHRTKVATIPWGDLDEDPAGSDEIAAVVTLTPKLPTAKSAQSSQVVVTSP